MPPAAYTPPPHGFRTFVIVWGTQSISVLGSALTYFGLNIWMVKDLYPLEEQKAQLALALSLTALIFSLPTVFMAPIAGAWADRHDRKRTMLVADFLNGLLALGLMSLIFSDLLQLWSMLVILFVQASLGAFHGSAFDTSYAMLVPDAQLPRANGMMQTIWSLSGLLSPGIAAAIIGIPQILRQGGAQGFVAGLKSGTPFLMAIDAATFFIAATVLLFVFIPSPQRRDLNAANGQPKKSMWADIRQGVLFIAHRPPMLWLLGTFAAVNFLTGPMGVLMPLLVKFNLQPDWAARGFTIETALALLGTLGSVGGVAGGIFISSWGGLRQRRVLGVVLPMVLAGLLLIAIGQSRWLFVTAGLMLVLDGLTPILNAHSQTIWQMQTPRELQGRVFAVRRVIAQFTWPLSTALAGALGGLFNISHVITVMGSLLAIFCIAQLFNPYLMRVEDSQYLDSLAARHEIVSQM